ncbi:DUF1365 family protein [Acetobacteraceae bacterium H6797]|nr:DUF1365 family protein [Acetobacteraceae bacterium H6797]
MNSCLYAGTVVHQRLKPLRHRLRYRMLMLLLDLDEMEALSRRLRFLSMGRFNLFGFSQRDHLDGSGTTLRAQVEAAMARAGLACDGGAIRLLCMPSVLGKVFNPLSIFFCHAADGRLRAVLYEVNNTFGQRHSYLIPAEATDGRVIRQQCAKRFYVSPFMEMEMTYHFRLSLPERRTAIAIDVRRGDESVLTACFAGERQALTDGALLRAFLRFPLMAGQVLAGIHWEALKLWIKGMRIRPRPLPPREAVSIAHPESL